MSINITLIGGNITRDIEIRTIATGTAVADFSIAVNEKYGEKESVHFFEVTAWGKTAEFVSKYFKKGDPILIEGRLNQETWKDKTTGDNRSKIKITAQKVNFMGGKRNEQPADPSDPTASADDNDDVPF